MLRVFPFQLRWYCPVTGEHSKRKSIVALAAAMASTVTLAGGVEGVWKTEANDDGAYLEVTMGPCEADKSLICGVISTAQTSDGPDPDYENTGKLIVKNMQAHGDNRYKGGTVWDPEKDKVYKSKMEVKGDDLDVEGCISFICFGQDWQRVK